MAAAGNAEYICYGEDGNGWEDTEYEIYSECFQAYDNSSYYDCCLQHECYNEPNELLKDCTLTITRNVQNLQPDLIQVTYVDYDPNPVDVTGGGYCTNRCTCVDICLSFDGHTYTCTQDPFSCENTDQFGEASTGGMGFRCGLGE